MRHPELERPFKPRLSRPIQRQPRLARLDPFRQRYPGNSRHRLRHRLSPAEHPPFLPRPARKLTLIRLNYGLAPRVWVHIMTTDA